MLYFTHMALFDLLVQACTVILTAFLAATHGSAAFIERHLPTDIPVVERVAADDVHAIFEALKTSADYQQSAALGSARAPFDPATIEDAVVNILCIKKTGGSVSGSGVFIDPRGVILTNAHVAQFLLLSERTDTEPTCTIRQGDPAQPRFEAALLYISPVWITENADQLNAAVPSGTGAHDFALLFVTEGANNHALPEAFAALVPLADEEYAYYDQSVSAAGYPAEDAPEIDNVPALAPRIADTTITHLFTFSSGNVDMFSVAPSTIGQGGSSGGPIVDDEGTVVGLIVTRGNAEREGIGSLRALTLPYINRMLEEETGLSLPETLSGSLALRADAFANTLMPYLHSLLVATHNDAG